MSELFKKGDRFTVTFTVMANQKESYHTVVALADGAVTINNLIEHTADFQNIVRVPVEIKAGQVWKYNPASNNHTCEVIYVDDESVLYEWSGQRYMVKPDTFRVDRTLQED